MDEESIAEVEALIRMDASGRRLVLDLRDVTLAGQEAVDFLARCEAAGIGLVGDILDLVAREFLPIADPDAAE